MNRYLRLVVVLAVLALAGSFSAMTIEERKAYLDKLLQTLPAVPSFSAWQQRTGEFHRRCRAGQ